MHDETLGNQRTLSHGSSPLAPTAAAGTVIGGRYEVVRFLGRGGMGEVFLCRDTKLGREVAVKRILSGGAQQPTLIERFRREAKAVAQLSHANIVTLFDFDVDEHGPFLVMELLRGLDLANHVKAHGPMPSGTVKLIALQLVSALQHAHAQGLVHRDIKPSNVFLQTNGSVKLLDFGIVRAADSVGLKPMWAWELPTMWLLSRQLTRARRMSVVISMRWPEH
jgi:serine/threonine protein kinase